MGILRLLENAENPEDYPAGSILFNAGDGADPMYALVDGEVWLRTGRSPATTRVRPGHIDREPNMCRWRLGETKARTQPGL